MVNKLSLSITLLNIYFAAEQLEAIVEFDYKAQEPDELTIKKGDIINDIRKQPGGWWEGTLVKTGKRGMFPDNFVKVSLMDCLNFNSLMKQLDCPTETFDLRLETSIVGLTPLLVLQIQ